MEKPDNYKTITKLFIVNKFLSELPSWISDSEKLEILDCSSNYIKYIINNLPLGLTELKCSKNPIKILDKLPPTLKKLDCSENCLKNLDNLPPTLEILNY